MLFPCLCYIDKLRAKLQLINFDMHSKLAIFLPASRLFTKSVEAGLLNEGDTSEPGAWSLELSEKVYFLQLDFRHVRASSSPRHRTSPTITGENGHHAPTRKYPSQTRTNPNRVCRQIGGSPAGQVGCKPVAAGTGGLAS